MANNLSIVFMDPTLSPYFETVYAVSESYVGGIFFVGAVVYIPLCPVSSYIAKRTGDYKSMMLGGCIFAGIAMFMMGPDSSLTGLPSVPWIAFFAMSLASLGYSLVFVPNIPDMM